MLLFFWVFFFKGQANEAICIQENMKCKFIAKEIHSDHDREGHVCVFFFISHCNAKTHKEEEQKQILD